jgi:4,4'-diaponeurosporenoate glycosyltransferase
MIFLAAIFPATIFPTTIFPAPLFPAILCAAGLLTGFLLIWRVPACSPAQPHSVISLSIIIPARNEEKNLPRLLQSIAASAIPPAEVIVVDDASSDHTALIARSFGANVIASAPLPAGWTGKAWACHQGAQRALAENLLFLDADTFFVDGGLDRLTSRWLRERNPRLAISLLPYHVMGRAYEHLSLFFNILMAAGAGGFGLLSQPRLFGQSLLIAKETYLAAGGHAAVRNFVLENLNLAPHIRAAGGRNLCLSGRGTLHMRMFPDGLRQMSDSWTKAFVHGAAVSGGLVLAAAVLWISALWSTAQLAVSPRPFAHLYMSAIYLLFCLQLVWFARQLGNYRFLACLLYPLPLAYYCAVFLRSGVRRAFRRKTIWRGRAV